MKVISNVLTYKKFIKLVDKKIGYCRERKRLQKLRDKLYSQNEELSRKLQEIEKENEQLKSQLAEHKEYCCCAKNEVLVLENAELNDRVKLLEAALKYSNSTIKLVLPLIDGRNSRVIYEINRMLDKTSRALILNK